MRCTYLSPVGVLRSVQREPDAGGEWLMVDVLMSQAVGVAETVVDVVDDSLGRLAGLVGLPATLRDQFLRHFPELQLLWTQCAGWSGRVLRLCCSYF